MDTTGNNSGSVAGGSVQQSKCPEVNCPFTYYLKSEYHRHLKVHNRPTPYLCPHPNCFQRCTSQYLLDKHFKVHLKVISLHCPLSNCSFVSTNKINLKKHMKAEHTIVKKTNTKNSIGKTSQDGERVEGADDDELVERGSHICTVCKFKGRSVGAQRINQRKYCNDEEGIRGVKTKRKYHRTGTSYEFPGIPYKCLECNFKAPTIQRVVNHYRTHNQSKMFNCDECNFTTEWHSILTRHKKNIHFYGTLRCFKCAQCTRSYRTSLHLKIHLIHHNDEKLLKL